MVLCHLIAPTKADCSHCGGRKLAQINENVTIF